MASLFTYFEPLESMDQVDQRNLISLFKQHWSGWDIFELNKSDAAKHPRFQEMLAHLSVLREVTPAGYREQCFLRWLAFDVVAPIDEPVLIMDYDVFPISTTPDQHWFIERFKAPTILDGLNPCAVYLPTSRFLPMIVEMLFRETIPDKERTGPHVGDNTVFRQHWVNIGGAIETSTVKYGFERNGGTLIHFANCTIPHEQKKYEFVMRNLGD